MKTTNKLIFLQERFHVVEIVGKIQALEQIMEKGRGQCFGCLLSKYNHRKATVVSYYGVYQQNASSSQPLCF